MLDLKSKLDVTFVTINHRKTQKSPSPLSRKKPRAIITFIGKLINHSIEQNGTITYTTKRKVYKYATWYLCYNGVTAILFFTWCEHCEIVKQIYP